MLIHFKDVDKELELPLGTARKYLTSIVAEYGYIPSKETSNTVRFVEEDVEDD